MDPRWLARPARPADYETFVRLVPELGVPDPIPDRDRWEQEYLPDIVFLEAEGAEAPVAYSWGKPFGDMGRIIHVVVDPVSRGRGVGRVLMGAVAARFRAAGCGRWELNVKVDNTPAIRLYERAGMRPAYRSTAVWLPWDALAALPREGSGASSIGAHLVEPAEEAALEAAFGVTPGRLGYLRKLGRVLVRLADAAAPEDARVGLAGFDPGFPGAFPFAVARPALAAPLLAALRAYGREGDARIHLLVEHDAALTAALCGAGASVAFEIAHMEGPLPVPAG